SLTPRQQSGAAAGAGEFRIQRLHDRTNSVLRGTVELRAQGHRLEFSSLFSKPLQRAGDWAADIIFQDHNDLIVDTGSMSEVADNRLVTVAHDFGTTARVH